MTTIRVRRFTLSDLPTCLAISHAVDPEHAVSLAEAQRDDAGWNTGRYHRSRCVAEAESLGIVGWGQITHTPWQFHPQKYELRLEVDPGRRRQGVGSSLLGRLLEELRA